MKEDESLVDLRAPMTSTVASMVNPVKMLQNGRCNGRFRKFSDRHEGANTDTDGGQQHEKERKFDGLFECCDRSGMALKVASSWLRWWLWWLESGKETDNCCRRSRGY